MVYVPGVVLFRGVLPLLYYPRVRPVDRHRYRWLPLRYLRVAGFCVQCVIGQDDTVPPVRGTLWIIYHLY